MTDAHDSLREEINRLLEQEKWAEAVARMKQESALVQNDFSLLWNLGWAHFKQGEQDEARAVLTRAVEVDPTNAIGRWALGQAYSASELIDSAELELLRSLALRDSYQGRLALGFLYHRTGRLAEAEAVHREGLRLQPNKKNRLEAFADFLADQDREAEARKYYDLADKAQD